MLEESRRVQQSQEDPWDLEERLARMPTEDILVEDRRLVQMIRMLTNRRSAYQGEALYRQQGQRRKRSSKMWIKVNVHQFARVDRVEFEPGSQRVKLWLHGRRFVYLHGEEAMRFRAYLESRAFEVNMPAASAAA